MNERIKELAEQANIGLFEDKSFGWNVIAGTDQHLSKFAELIVKECARIAREHTLSKWDLDDSYSGTVIVEKAIKEHFGVKE